MSSSSTTVCPPRRGPLMSESGSGEASVRCSVGWSCRVGFLAVEALGCGFAANLGEEFAYHVHQVVGDLTQQGGGDRAVAVGGQVDRVSASHDDAFARQRPESSAVVVIDLAGAPVDHRQ